MVEKCPKCRKGRLYDKKDENGVIAKACFVCGYYSETSRCGLKYPESLSSLFHDYFPTEEGWPASPDVGQPFTSPEHWTEPAV